MRYYVVRQLGHLISRHRTADAARRAAARVARETGLADDGAYCADDGWPAIESPDGSRCDYRLDD